MHSLSVTVVLGWYINLDLFNRSVSIPSTAFTGQLICKSRLFGQKRVSVTSLSSALSHAIIIFTLHQKPLRSPNFTLIPSVWNAANYYHVHASFHSCAHIFLGLFPFG